MSRGKHAVVNPGSSVEVSQALSASLFLEEFPDRNANRCQLSNVKVEERNSVKLFPDKNASLFLGSNAAAVPVSNAEMYHLNNAV